jgi:hypothetical protein
MHAGGKADYSEFDIDSQEQWDIYDNKPSESGDSKTTHKTGKHDPKGRHHKKSKKNKNKKDVHKSSRKGHKSANKHKSHQKKRKASVASTCVHSSSSDTSSDESDASSVDEEAEDAFPGSSCKYLGGLYLQRESDQVAYAKLVYPLKNKRNLVEKSPGKAPKLMLSGIAGSQVSAKHVDMAIFIMTNQGPNTRLARYEHLGNKSGKRTKADFRECLITEAERLGKAMCPPQATRLEEVLDMQNTGPSTKSHNASISKHYTN